jgi:hypothetical protein
VLAQVAKDLKSAFPETKGFSRSNLMYMRLFAESWPDAQIVQQVVGQLPWGQDSERLALDPQRWTSIAQQ